MVRSRLFVCTCVALLGVLLASTLAPASAVDASPTAGALTLDVDLPYPAFPCNFTADPNPCWLDMVGSLGGTLSGTDVNGDVPWAVEFNGDVTARIPYLTLWLLTYPVPTGWCRYENSRGAAVATSIHASGTYGGTPVTGVEITGELGYLRVGTDAAGVAFDHMIVTLSLEDGSRETVSAGRFGAGVGTWKATEGSIPSDCTADNGNGAPFNGPPLTARLQAAMVAGVQPQFG